MNDEEKVRELRLMIENFEGITSKFVSDHILNLLEDLEAQLPDGKEKMLGTIDEFLSMDQNDKDKFIIARRLGMIRYFSDYRRDDKYEDLKKEILEKFPSIDEAIMQISLNYL